MVVEGGELDAGQVELPGDDAIEADAAATVGGAACLAEEIDIFADAGAGGVDALLAATGLELVRVVNQIEYPGCASRSRTR